MKLIIFVSAVLAFFSWYYPAIGMVTLFAMALAITPFVVLLLLSSSLRIILGLIIWLISFDKRKDK